MNRLVIPIIAVALIVCFAGNTSRAQTILDRWSLGIHAGVNYWITDYNEYKIGTGGNLQLRYDPARYLGLGLSAGYEILKTNQSVPLESGAYASYMKLNAIPVAFIVTLHFYPRKTVNPYVYAGFGAIMFERTNDIAAVDPVDNKWRTSYMIPAGFGIEAFTSSAMAFDASVGFANFADWADARPTTSFKGYLSLKLGVNFYLNEGATLRRPGGALVPH